MFSVSSTKQVHFSQGNLQYQASTNTWRFAEMQWDFVGGTDFYTGELFGNVYESQRGAFMNTRMKGTRSSGGALICVTY